MSRVHHLGLLGLSLLLSCAQSVPDGGSYFPLDAGRHWEYRSTLINPLQTQQGLLRIENMGLVPDPFQDDAKAYLRQTSQGMRYWHVRDGAGVRRVASQGVAQPAPVADSGPRWVLPAEATAQEWMVPTRPYALERAEPFRERFYADPSAQFPLHFEVVNRNTSVEVPAGRFDHCWKIRAQGELAVHADPRIGVSTVPVTQEEWYAPGVGLVKLVRREDLDTTNVVGGEFRLELVRWRD
nr:hypothetical protein [Oceanococcus sp. HetDA_MAG_MS8]